MFDRIDRLASLAGWVVMKLGAVAVLVMMAAIILQVIASRAGVTTVIELEGTWPVFGEAVTLNSLTDLQWYLLALIALIPAGVVWLRGVHVRVDFAYTQLGPRGKTVVDLIGLVVFAAPFLIYMIPDAWDLATKAFERGEGSPNGGLQDRYLPRAAIPVGFVLLAIAILYEAVRLLRGWRRRDG